MKSYKIYHISKAVLWNYLQKLFRSKGDSILMFNKMLLMVTVIIAQINLSSAQTKSNHSVATKTKQIPEIKQYEYLPDAVQDMPLELQYFDGKAKVMSSFRKLSENFVQLFFWDASYADHLTDLKKIYDYKEEMGASSTFILVISKHDKGTMARIASALERFKKEYRVDMDIASIIGNTNLDKLFKVPVFPKYVQINPKAVFVTESSLAELLKNRARKN
ncbi:MULTISPECIES: hypothetical protein [unclassified Sphingobacterium]|uniref:hypothetical protein n=1 Tax=unclassified Sphingobacterium TaxID=2609468 RepID=UPI00104765F2|nr:MULTISPECIES: hypothetical protein [unclassified Sphingobacterium]MCS3557429.1 hypothetical protein [Sphingobacterium sp. JUb21]TCQ96316.1 hypothetical protein EDF66_12218 [Sphingobacterium sp. JUb20]